MARAYMTNALVDGAHPRRAALDMVGRVNKATGRREGGFIGLTKREADYTDNALARLRSGDPAEMRKYLRMKNRNKTFDPIVRAAIKDGKPVKAAQARSIIGKMKDKVLRKRGERIAQDQTLTALRAGQHEGFGQLLGSGAINDDQIERSWDATGDSRTRDDHAQMEGQTVIGMQAPFVAPDGSRLMFPGDSSLGAPASQTVLCRCRERIRVRYINR